MAKILSFLILAALGIVFVIQNSEHVVIQLVIGNPIRIRLIFLLLVFFAIGYLLAKFEGLHRERRFKKKLAKIHNK
ncbi:MAG: hypothetical protein ISR65_02125 [Bacteriovoracaceae bacterium]|nr:hypothetical protein [Bacteriovoracaceae bacterium]